MIADISPSSEISETEVRKKGEKVTKKSLMKMWRDDQQRMKRLEQKACEARMEVIRRPTLVPDRFVITIFSIAT